MGRPATLAVRITADASRAARGAQQAQRAFSSLGSHIKALAVTAGALALGGGIADFAKRAVSSASEVEQNFGALDAVFKGSSGQMKQWAAGAAQSAGLSKAAYSGMAVTLGASLKNQGVAVGDVGKLTNDLITKGADLASMFGGTTAEAVDALSSAFRGEADPAERYGLNLSQTAVNAYKAAHASQKLTDTQARLALITQQSKDATGNFAKESDTLGGQQQRLAAQFDNMAAALGAKVLPVLTQVAQWANDKLLPAVGSVASAIGERLGPALSLLGGWLSGTVLPAVKDFGQTLVTRVIPGVVGFVKGVVDAGKGVVQTARDFAPLLVAAGAIAALLAGPLVAAFVVSQVQLGILAVQVGALTVAQRVAAVATKAWAVAQRLFNLVLSANPLVRVAMLVIALGAAVYTAYQKSETFRRIVDAVWGAVKRAGAYIGGAFVSAFNACKNAVGWVVDKVKAVVSWFGRIRFPNPLNMIRDGFNRIRDAAQWVIDKVRSVIDWIGKIPGGGLLKKAIDLVTYSAAPPSPAAYGPTGYASSPGALRDAARVLRPSTTVYITMDGTQLQGRITRTVVGAMNADGARLQAGGWA
ncbi:hypothetical protein GCM10010329_50120 [Streptomyces spiroverticillatus]|uniref:Tape measure protein n=1 Tax=Streptomyces finlayi TaxID=67296 RepID=A0A919CC52_9ACTN|nr:hypothetical protein [Streptomyces finlayi]GHA20706.1 hypothetical protein GCM10010329_50120 [Streptomyces spiroverticillatus]GHD03380.1 hypothetical protein GCM10010334_51070 [Streptomyces finlayi]